jgi:hypothetical protein
VGGGAEGIRTPDLLIANQPLYQLSYDPIHEWSDPIVLAQKEVRCNKDPAKNCFVHAHDSGMLLRICISGGRPRSAYCWTLRLA